MKHAPRLFLFSLAAMVGASVWAAAHFDVTELDAGAVTERLRAAGPLAPLALLALLFLQCVIAPLPSEPLMMAAGYLFGPTLGFLLSWIAVTLGSCACFALAAGVGRSFALRYVGTARLAALDARIAARGLVGLFFMLLAIRLVAFSSFDVVSYACGLLRVPFPWFVLASTVGVTPKVFAFTYLGTSMDDVPGWLAVLIGGGTAGIVLGVPWLTRVWRAPQPEAP